MYKVFTIFTQKTKVMEENTKKVTITITQKEIKKAAELSKSIFGKVNVSGYIRYLIRSAVILALMCVISCRSTSIESELKNNIEHKSIIKIDTIYVYKTVILDTEYDLPSKKDSEHTKHTELEAEYKYYATWCLMTVKEVIDTMGYEVRLDGRRVYDLNKRTVDFMDCDESYKGFFKTLKDALYFKENRYKYFEYIDYVNVQIDSIH